MKTILRLLLFILLTSFFSCEKGYLTSCPDCTVEEPVYTELEIYSDHATSSFYYPTIEIYEGNLEDSILIKSFTTNGRDITYFEGQINKLYTATATYNIGNRTYITVDSTVPRVRFEENECDEPCYYVFSRNLDLRLKYQ
jgi:hypothetical protein